MRDILDISQFVAAFAVLTFAVMFGVSWIPGVGTYHDAAAITQAAVTVIAILTAAMVAGSNGVLRRRSEPYISVSSKTTHRQLDPQNIHLRITANLHNTSRVQVVFETGVMEVRQLVQAARQEYEYVPVYGKILREDMTGFSQRIDLGAHPLDWRNQTIIVEPRETRRIAFEVITDDTVESVRIRFCFHHRWHQARSGSVSGWESVTFHDIV